MSKFKHDSFYKNVLKFAYRHMCGCQVLTESQHCNGSGRNQDCSHTDDGKRKGTCIHQCLCCHQNRSILKIIPKMTLQKNELPHIILISQECCTHGTVKQQYLQTSPLVPISFFYVFCMKPKFNRKVAYCKEKYQCATP